ncbi:MAG: helix-turn-helix domain-containing protein, partial [Bacteroidales bacterium]|nr:helix-turn-helix domain-containing protein [Bacteroidales bacterium]
DLTINQFVTDLPSREPNEEQFEYNRKLYESQMLFELIDFHDIESDLNGIRKVVFANKGSFDATVSEKIAPKGQKFHEEVVEVSEKFKRQIGGILRDNFQIDNNLQLQDRIKKGCSYFLDKMADLDEIAGLPFETDNKAVNEQIKKELDAYRTDFYVKKACLESCLGGFEMKKYLATKNKKIVEAEELNKSKKAKLARKQLSRDDMKLFKALVAWREQVADALEISETRVIPTTTLTAIAEKKPMSVKELKALSKVGATRLQRFGADILNIVLEHQGFKKHEFDDEESKEELELGASVSRTKELIEEGLSIDEIAEKRSMARSTIEQHVAELVLKGYADAKNFMSEEHYENIVEYFTETQDSSLGAAKDVLGEEYSWGELRIVLNEMKRES